MQRSNILLVIVDCARSEKTIVDLPEASPFTRRSARLPLVEYLQGRGTTWTDVSAVSSTTTPSIASLLTGLLPAQHGIREHSRHSLRIDVPTVTELLRRAGYHTYAEVTGPLLPEAGLNRGFAQYSYRDHTEYLHTGLLERLEQRLSDLAEPWFLCLHLWESHQPYQHPVPFNSLTWGYTAYDRSLSFVDECLFRLLQNVDLQRTSVVYTAGHGERLPEDYERQLELGGHDAAIFDLYRRFSAEHPESFPFDRWFERVRDTFGEVTARIHAHGVIGHGFHLTEDLIRIPVVIAGPERCAGGEVRHELRSQLDLGATLLDLAGIDDTGDDRLAGRSLLERGGEELVYIEANGSGGEQFASRCYLRGARSKRWKYWRVEADRLEHRVLWDLEHDPRETRNVAADHQAVCKRMDDFVSGCLAAPDATPPTGKTDSAGDGIEQRLKELGYR